MRDVFVTGDKVYVATVTPEGVYKRTHMEILRFERGYAVCKTKTRIIRVESALLNRWM